MITCKVRFSYLNVFEPKETPSGDMKYSASLLIEKDNAQGIKEIKDAIKAAVDKGLSTNKFSKAQVPGLRLPLRDGDTEFESGNRGEEYKDHFFVNCSSKNKPGIVDAQAKPIFDSDEFYSGCFGRVDINFFPYNQAGNRGIGVGLNNVMKVKDGGRLDGRQSAESAFEKYATEETDVMDTANGDLE